MDLREYRNRLKAELELCDALIGDDVWGDLLAKWMAAGGGKPNLPLLACGQKWRAVLAKTRDLLGAVSSEPVKRRRRPQGRKAKAKAKTTTQADAPPAPLGERVCKDCGDTKPLKDFCPMPKRWHNAENRGYKATCRECFAAKISAARKRTTAAAAARDARALDELRKKREEG